MKNLRLIKITAVLLLLVMAVLTLASCGSSGGNADDASGTHGSLNWTYVKDTKTLTVTGAGDLASFENSDAVVWKAVGSSAKRLVVGEGITSIGNYAFYYMSVLEEVTLPTTLSTIGDYAFGFCTTLESVTIPDGVTSIGKGAFEGCGAMKSMFLPASVTAIGDRAFAFCYSMTNVIVTGELETVGEWAFKSCRSLESLTLRTTQSADAFAGDTFEDASKNLESATRTDNATGATTVTVHYMLDGAEIETKVEEFAYGKDYSINTPSKDGYTADILTVTGKADGSAHDATVTYTKNPEVETAPAEEEDEPVSVMTYVSIGIMALVLVGIGVGAFFLLRSDKKQAKKGTTVRKNDPKNAKKKK